MTVIISKKQPVTAEQIGQWEQERDELRDKIQELQQRANAISAMIQAGQYFLPDGATDEDEPDPSNFMGTLANLVQESAYLMSKKELKAKASAAGVSEEKLNSPYFYVTLGKLKKAKRIQIHSDGRIGRVPSK